MRPIVVKQDEAAPVPAEVMADAILRMATVMQDVNGTRLTRRALVALIYDQSKVPKKQIELVLNNLSNLERDWLKPEVRK